MEHVAKAISMFFSDSLESLDLDYSPEITPIGVLRASLLESGILEGRHIIIEAKTIRTYTFSRIKKMKATQTDDVECEPVSLPGTRCSL